MRVLAAGSGHRMRVVYAACLLCPLLLSGSACGRSSPAEPEFDHVAVQIARGRISVGDTVTVYVGAYTAFGYRVGWTGRVTWTVSDSTVARLEPTDKADKKLARGLRVGTVTIQATIAGKTGQSPLHVVP